MRTLLCAAWAALSTAAPEARAQRPADSTQAMAGAVAAMGGDDMAHMKHMAWSPARTMTVKDSIRAMAIADTLRRAIAKYADTAFAVRDGYKMFAPSVKNQAVYHFTRRASGLKSAFTFDAAKPTSLLYKRDAAGHLKLIGAMYTAPARFSQAKLDARVPLSVAQWHQHVNLCIPRDKKELDRMRAGDHDTHYGLLGDIADRGACEKANGRFVERIFGWMVHANVFEGRGVRDVWETEASHGQR